MKCGRTVAAEDGAFARRCATRVHATADRGLKPTATSAAPLRDEWEAMPSPFSFVSSFSWLFVLASFAADWIHGGGQAGGDAAAIAGLVQPYREGGSSDL
jgi:hypothetical protein